MPDIAGTAGNQHILHSERMPFLKLMIFSGEDGSGQAAEVPSSAANFGRLIHIFWVQVFCFCEFARRPFCELLVL
jgi:hypothetical protein